MEDVIEMGNTGMAPDNELEQRYIRYKDVIKELTIMNDIFMRNVLKKRECAEYILRIIMEMKNLQVVDMTASILARDNKMPMWVFGLNEENSIVNTVKGNFKGTKVTV